MKANLVRAKIKEKGVTQDFVAKSMGISTNPLSRKLLGKREFRLSEILSLCEILDIENPQVVFMEK